MKHFLRKLIMLAAIAGVVMWVKDRVTPTNEHAAAGGPSATQADTKPAATSSAADVRRDAPAPTTEDDLTRLKGIGPVYQARLADQGITSFQDLAAADAASVAGAIDASVQQVEDWQERVGTLD